MEDKNNDQKADNENKNIRKYNEQVEEKVYSKDLCETKRSDLYNIYYNCSECSSIIEILSLNKNQIEFKCNNKHHITMYK